jgi:hypothetical protein
MNVHFSKKTIAIVSGAGLLVALGTTGGAVAATLVTGKDIQDSTIGMREFKDGVKNRIGTDGLSSPIVGSGYAGLGAHDYWAAHSYGETLETCPAGQTAIGGGYSQDASTGVDGKYDLGGKADVQVTVSAPYFKGEYAPVDEAGNFRADQWVVRGYNNSDQPVDVRAWVVCADIAS